MDIARYAELFRTESRDHLSRIDAELVSLGAIVEAAPAGASLVARVAPPVEAARARVDALFRSMHTIKGMAGAMGYEVVEQLAHGAEQLLDEARRDPSQLQVPFLALVQEVADALANQVDDAVEGRAPRPVAARLVDRLQRWLRAQSAQAVDPQLHQPAGEPDADVRDADVRDADVRGADVRGAVGSVPPDLMAPPRAPRAPLRPLAAAPAPKRTRLVTVELRDDAPLKSVRAQVVLARLETLGRVHSTEPPVSSITDRFSGALQVLLESSESDDRLVAAVHSAGDVAGVSVRGRQARAASAEGVRQVRVDADRLDALLDLVGELVIGRDRLLRATEQTADAEIRESVRTVAGLVRTLQEEILQTRMVPASHVLDRFPRLVRDVAREVDKEVVFAMEGRDLHVDRAMLDAIVDPIIHLLRNAIDHGIEDARTRAAVGKPAVGRLVLRAVRDRSAVVITVQDDGRGIDRDRVYAKAVADGHLVPRARAEGSSGEGACALSDEQLIELLAVPGFSTADQVTSVSGRGVGIDVVASRVRALGGSLMLHSTPGQGTVVSLRLPVALSIVPAMLVRAGAARYAVPSAHVIEVLEGVSPEALCGTRMPADATVRVRGEALPYRRLGALLGEPLADGTEPQWLVLEVAGKRLVCEVDALLGQQDVVVKPFAPLRGLPALFAGATILGDGSPALIVDIGGLA